MKRERQEFYYQLRAICWQITGTSREQKACTLPEQEIYYDAIIKLRSLQDKLKKEYEKEYHINEKN